MTEVSEIATASPDRTARELAALSASMDRIEAGTKMAIVAPQDHAFGLGRMYEAYRSFEPASKKEVAVFPRTISEALAFLGLGGRRARVGRLATQAAFAGSSSRHFPSPPSSTGFSSPCQPPRCTPRPARAAPAARPRRCRSTTSWNCLMSNRVAEPLLRLVAQRRISSWPILYASAWPGQVM